MFFIYEIKNITNNKKYIGVTKNLRKRKNTHFSLLRNNKHHNIHLQNAYNKYGIKNFVFSVISERIDSSEDAFLKEIDLISKFGYYNLTSGGEGHSGLNKKKCIWNGVEFDSIKEASEFFGEKYSTFKYRIKNGYKKNSDFREYRKETIWNGKRFKTQKECAKHLGISVSSMNERVKKGYTSDSDMIGKGGYQIEERK